MRNRRGQSLLELAAVITLVTLAIFFAGPTVIREINAYFKFWDDSIQDSYNDPMRKAPLTDLADCKCTDWQGAVGQRCGVSPCPPMYHLESRLCNPAGCGQAMGWEVERCICDPLCCGQFIDTPNCGLGTNAPDDCPLNQRMIKAECGATDANNCRSGGGGSKMSCRLDLDPIEVDGNPSCAPKCFGTYVTTAAEAQANPALPILCPGDDTDFPNGTVFTRDVNGTVGIPIKITTGGESTCNPQPDHKCEVHCLDGYIPFGFTCIAPKCPNIPINAQYWDPDGPGSIYITGDPSYSETKTGALCEWHCNPGFSPNVNPSGENGVADPYWREDDGDVLINGKIGNWYCIPRTSPLVNPIDELTVDEYYSQRSWLPKNCSPPDSTVKRLQRVHILDGNTASCNPGETLVTYCAYGTSNKPEINITSVTSTSVSGYEGDRVNPNDFIRVILYCK